MIKRAFLALAMLAAATVAQAAGTVPGFSLTPQFDALGKVMPGCRLYVYQAGTVATPQNAYQDTALTIALPNPLQCDSSGRLPQWFVADGLIKIRLTTASGSQVFSSDNLLVVGPSSGGGGGGTVDPTTILTTGDMKLVYGTGIVSGFVRANGRTIGSATSGATERANADTQALFTHLWNNDSSLTVSGGRGANAAADWSANKTIALPDWRGRAIAGLDDMGNTAAGKLTRTYFGTGATTLGADGGDQSHAITASESAVLSYNITINGTIPARQNTDQAGSGSNVQNIWVGTQSNPNGLTATTTTNAGGNPHTSVQPTKLLTIYIKL
jgi:microcystin-dependent protein